MSLFNQWQYLYLYLNSPNQILPVVFQMPKFLDGVKLVIFDLDGVILDVIDAIRRSAAEWNRKI